MHRRGALPTPSRLNWIRRSCAASRPTNTCLHSLVNALQAKGPVHACRVALSWANSCKSLDNHTNLSILACFVCMCLGASYLAPWCHFSIVLFDTSIYGCIAPSEAMPCPSLLPFVQINGSQNSSLPTEPSEHPFESCFFYCSFAVIWRHNCPWEHFHI